MLKFVWLSVSVLSCMHCPSRQKKGTRFVLYATALLSVKGQYLLCRHGKAPCRPKQMCALGPGFVVPLEQRFLFTYCSFVAGTTIIHEEDVIVDSHFTEARDFPEKVPARF